MRLVKHAIEIIALVAYPRDPSRCSGTCSAEGATMAQPDRLASARERHLRTQRRIEALYVVGRIPWRELHELAAAIHDAYGAVLSGDDVLLVRVARGVAQQLEGLLIGRS